MDNTWHRELWAPSPSPVGLRPEWLPPPPNDRTVERLLRMVDGGAGPRDVAEKFQVSVRTVGRWRRLPGFSWASRPDPRHNQLTLLWRSDLTMERLGEELSVSRTTVRRWARELRLGGRAPRRPPSVESMVRPDIRRMVRQGLHDEAIADQLDLAVSTVAAYRRREGWVYRSGSAVDTAGSRGSSGKGCQTRTWRTSLGYLLSRCASTGIG